MITPKILWGLDWCSFSDFVALNPPSAILGVLDWRLVARGRYTTGWICLARAVHINLGPPVTSLSEAQFDLTLRSSSLLLG